MIYLGKNAVGVNHGGVTVSPLSVTDNGTYTAPSGEAYSPVTVNVSGGGVQLVYELATPITYDIDPVTLTLLRGDNNVWADTGDTTLTYQVDIPLYKQHQANS